MSRRCPLLEIVKRIRALTIKLLPLEIDVNALNDPTSVDGIPSQFLFDFFPYLGLGS